MHLHAAQSGGVGPTFWKGNIPMMSFNIIGDHLKPQSSLELL